MLFSRPPAAFCRGRRLHPVTPRTPPHARRGAVRNVDNFVDNPPASAGRRPSACLFCACRRGKRRRFGRVFVDNFLPVYAKFGIIIYIVIILVQFFSIKQLTPFVKCCKMILHKRVIPSFLRLCMHKLAWRYSRRIPVPQAGIKCSGGRIVAG